MRGKKDHFESVHLHNYCTKKRLLDVSTMSHVYILTQTEYKHHEDYEREENRDVSVLEVYTTATAANEAAKDWVKEYFEDGDNEVKKDEHGCDTWTCQLARDDQSHVLISVVIKALLGEPEDESEVGGEEEEEEKEDEEEGESEEEDAQEPPAKKARQA